MYANRLELRPAKPFKPSDMEAPKKPEPKTHMTIAECEWLLGNRSDIKVEWHEKMWEEFKISSHIYDASIDFDGISAAAKRNAKKFGYDIIIEEDFRALIISFEPKSAERVNGRTAVRREQIKGARYIIGKPANMKFQPNEKRLAVLGEIIANWTNYWRPEYTDITDLPKAWIDRLFDEGMTQRSNKSARLVRPTVAGIRWHHKHTKAAAK